MLALRAALELPSLAATHLEATNALTPQNLAAAEKFALGDYLTTLAGPPLSADAAKAFYERIAKITGLPADAIAQWWDLSAIAARHETFLSAHGASLAAYRADPGPRNAFRRWILALDAWRPIPYVDPGLPLSLLPDDWPGRRSIPAFLELRDALSVPAAEYVHTVVAAPARAAQHRRQEPA